MNNNFNIKKNKTAQVIIVAEMFILLAFSSSIFAHNKTHRAHHARHVYHHVYNINHTHHTHPKTHNVHHVHHIHKTIHHNHHQHSNLPTRHTHHIKKFAPQQDHQVADIAPHNTALQKVINTVQKVIKTAYTELGKPYKYASDGPNAFDCSGLTKYSFEQAGIHIPHNAAEQMRYGKYVAYGDLKPGDLVFFHHAAHVGLYLGQDKYIHAPQTGEFIRIDRLSMSRDYCGARHIIQIPTSTYAHNSHRHTRNHFKAVRA
jgi:hypothetical protein